MTPLPLDAARFEPLARVRARASQEPTATVSASGILYLNPSASEGLESVDRVMLWIDRAADLLKLVPAEPEAEGSYSLVRYGKRVKGRGVSLAGALAYLEIPLPTGRPIPVPVMCQGQERTVQLAGLRTHEQTTEAP